MANRSGSVLIYEGDGVLGELDVYPQNGAVPDLNELRVSLYLHSKRCPPLAVLLTVAARGACFIKLESTLKNHVPDVPLSVLHATCIRDNKSVVATTGKHEFVLVAMRSNGQKQNPCFWGFNVSADLYKTCQDMLNQWFLGIVFDLDETLVVGNTQRSFKDKMDELMGRIREETDEGLVLGMHAELRRYHEDYRMLMQYAKTDEVVENGKVVKAQFEQDTKGVRPVIRLEERNIILTRINPQISDTSVLVRLRPGWKELRSYLNGGRDRKRFEVFVCTMAEREYALEMWRLLDPASQLINSTDVSNRIVNVKSENKKSLLNVFKHSECHPEMAFVVDDRVDVWDEKDQARVHVIPAFAPYHAPQAEPNNAPMHVLHVTRNVACYVRNGFYNEFSDCLTQQISRVAYEDDIRNMRFPPNVNDYLLPDTGPPTKTPPATNMEPPFSFPSQQLHTVTSSEPPKPEAAHPGKEESVIMDSSSPGREEGEVPESELDPNTRRRLLISQHGSTDESPAGNFVAGDHPVHANPFNVAFPTTVAFPTLHQFPPTNLGPKINAVAPNQCKNCKKYGHIKKKCPMLPKKNMVWKRKPSPNNSAKFIKKNDKKKMKKGKQSE